MALTDLQVATLVERYLRERDRFDKMAFTVLRHLTAELRASAIPHVPTSRVKTPGSLSAKLKRDRQQHELDAFKSEFAPSVLDLAGVRILLYSSTDQDPTCDVIERLFLVQDGERFRKNHTNEDGYKARHRVAMLRDEMLSADPNLANLAGVYCEIQVAMLSDHIWNELEHDIRYKTPIGKPSDEQLRLLRVLRRELNVIGGSVDELIEATARQRETNLTTIESAEDLSEALRYRTGRRLRGDFSGLLRLLSATLSELSRAQLDRLPLDKEALDAATERLQSAGGADQDGVSLIVAALWPLYADDFVLVVSSWRGRPGPVWRTILALQRAREGGTI